MQDGVIATNFDFESAIIWLAVHRAKYAEAKKMKSDMLNDLYDSAPWMEAQAEEEVAENAALHQADAIRNMAILNYQQIQDKHPHDAVNIRIQTQLEYDEAEALNYARQHLPQALSLNKRTFEKVAKVLELDFVKEVEEPQATISTDLSKWLK